ncbi:MAG: RDD family protein [Armatimonadota bacterium]|nr:RDD family protein [Armatimonadota bacterium]
MTSAERMVMVAARSEALLVDFVIVFVIRWGLKWLGVDYLYFQPILDQVAPPLSFEDFRYTASALFWGTMFFSCGMPEVILAGVWFAYSVICLSTLGKTLGMHHAGVILRNSEGSKPSVFQIIVRQLLVPISSIAWLGFIPAGFTPHAETFHDLVSRTYVAFAPKSRTAESDTY